MAKPFAFCALYHIKESCIKLKKVKRDHHPMNMSIGRETGLVNFKITHTFYFIHRGYYAVARRYEFYVRVASQNNISRVSTANK